MSSRLVMLAIFVIFADAANLRKDEKSNSSPSGQPQENNDFVSGVAGNIQAALKTLLDRIMPAVDRYAPSKFPNGQNDVSSAASNLANFLPSQITGGRLLNCPVCQEYDASKLAGNWRLIYASDNFVKVHLESMVKMSAKFDNSQKQTERFQQPETNSMPKVIGVTMQEIFTPQRVPVCVKFQFGDASGDVAAEGSAYPVQFAFKSGTVFGSLRVGYGTAQTSPGDGTFTMQLNGGDYPIKLCMLSSNFQQRPPATGTQKPAPATKPDETNTETEDKPGATTKPSQKTTKPPTKGGPGGETEGGEETEAPEKPAQETTPNPAGPQPPKGPATTEKPEGETETDKETEAPEKHDQGPTPKPAGPQQTTPQPAIQPPKGPATTEKPEGDTEKDKDTEAQEKADKGTTPEPAGLQQTTSPPVSQPSKGPETTKKPEGETETDKETEAPEKADQGTSPKPAGPQQTTSPPGTLSLKGPETTKKPEGETETDKETEATEKAEDTTSKPSGSPATTAPVTVTPAETATPLTTKPTPPKTEAPKTGSQQTTPLAQNITATTPHPMTTPGQPQGTLPTTATTASSASGTTGSSDTEDSVTEAPDEGEGDKKTNTTASAKPDEDTGDNEVEKGDDTEKETDTETESEPDARKRFRSPSSRKADTSGGRSMYMVLSEVGSLSSCQNFIVLANDDVKFFEEQDMDVMHQMRLLSADTDANPLQYIGCPCGYNPY